MPDNLNKSDVILEVKDLKMRFGKLEVLRGVNTTVRRGEVIVVIGASGAGKSTFLRCLNRLETPTDGDILFAGESVVHAGRNLNTLRERMGMVFQQFNLFNNLTVKKNITLAPVKIGIADLRKAKLHNAFVPLYNKWFARFGAGHNAKVEKKREELRSKVEMFKTELEPIVSEWEQTKTVEEAAGKSVVSYDPVLTKKKLSFTA